MAETTFKSENYFKTTPKKLIKLGVASKGFIGAISASAFFSGNEKIAFVLLVIGALLDETIKFFSDETTQN